MSKHLLVINLLLFVAIILEYTRKALELTEQSDTKYVFILPIKIKLIIHVDMAP
jgi:hypothetical protein